jgi:hypothetical protein
VIAEEPDFSDPESLAAIIENRALKFIHNVESFLDQQLVEN